MGSFCGHPPIETVAAALPEGAWWAIAHGSDGADISRILPEDLRSGVAWGVVCVDRRRVRLTELGERIASLPELTREAAHG